MDYYIVRHKMQLQTNTHTYTRAYTHYLVFYAIVIT